MKKEAKTLYVTTRSQWRQWLKIHHQDENEIWLIYYKKHTAKSRIPYNDAVEEAICFGWIDSLIKRIDDEKFRQKFTPRTNIKQWSELNKKRAQRMINEKKMTEAGLAKIDFESWKNEKQKGADSTRPQFSLSKEMKKELQKNQTVWRNFNNLPPSQQRNYIGWIMSAKKEETRQKRLKETIILLKKNQKLGLK